MVDRQDVLRDAWLGGSIGHFSALTEARIWALREAWREFKDSEYGMTKFIAERVTVVGGNDPWSSAITEFLNGIQARKQETSLGQRVSLVCRTRRQ